MKDASGDSCIVRNSFDVLTQRTKLGDVLGQHRPILSSIPKFLNYVVQVFSTIRNRFNGRKFVSSIQRTLISGGSSLMASE